MLTKEIVERAVPANLKSAITQSLVDNVNNATADPLIAEQIRNNFVSYVGVLKDGKFKTEDYLSAVCYVSYKLMGDSNRDAYFKTFPQRYQLLLQKGTSEKDISSYVSAYNKGKLVNLIMEQSLVPTWVLNQDVHQRAINRLAHLMDSAQSEKVQADAAIGLLTHLAKPKEAGPLINIDARETSGMTELKDLLGNLAAKQLELIQAGVTAKEIAAQRIVDVDAKVV
ncbi:hypothetical protein [Paraburkholderia sp. SIMBA_054]|uniref:hypothetical protein n=1 Tax=Paraburkholderia sp. SIMBA_054 TaxID=3085795 RepID=UPI003979745F